MLSCSQMLQSHPEMANKYMYIYIQFSNHQAHWNEQSRGHATKRMGVIEQESQTDSQTGKKTGLNL